MVVVKIDSQKAFDELLESGKLIVVDFYADWCGPCKQIAPKIEGLSKECEGVIFCKVDVDDNGDIAEKYGIQAMPTFKFFLNSAMAGEVVGANFDRIKEEVKKLEPMAKK